MAVELHQKIDIAAEQLESAIDLYASGRYAASATLAGAAEEILGSHVRLIGMEPDLDRMARGVSKFFERLTGAGLSHRDAQRVINHTKNSLKHMDSESDSSISVDLKDEANTLIWRAIHNYDRLNMPYNATIAGFPSNVSDE